MNTLKEMLGSRILYKRQGNSDVSEGTVLELTTDEKFVKLDSKSGRWYAADAISVLQELPGAGNAETAPRGHCAGPGGAPTGSWPAPRGPQGPGRGNRRHGSPGPARTAGSEGRTG